MFTPKVNKKRKPFTIIMPPPNANGDLHAGHARFVTQQDLLTRYHRMKGEVTLWLPGADHAGIETQYVFEKELSRKGKSRFDYDRETLYKKIWDYVMKNKGTMENQLKSLGASCDWSRYKFTLDEDVIQIVYETFKDLYDDGLIYRGEQLVNYCPRCGTNFSDLEVDHVEKAGKMYYIDYKSVTIATTRPETIFADVAVAINPKDKKLARLKEKEATIPLVNRNIPIITDSLVDLELGTGALKITPGHDQTDFEIGKKHNLPIISVIDKEGKMINTPKTYIGMDVKDARERIVKDLEDANRLKRVETIKHSVGVCYRDKGVIEPLISKQWFIKIESLADAALTAIRKREVRFNAERNKKIAVHWLKNLRDWNISRQIIWGIRIPAWRCDKCMDWTITKGDKPDKCSSCNHADLTQDKDTFDTWFSSGQWPYATLQTTKEGDFDYFYPTTVMNTAYDILPFWVLRMIMLGIYSTGKVPFSNVMLYGLVRDKKGDKMSKSKGNVIDPLEITEKYGTDALRMSLVWGALVENDISLSEDNVRGQRNFANKLWNVARYVFSGKDGKSTVTKAKRRPNAKNKDDKEIVRQLNNTTKKMTRLLDDLRLNEAAEEIYDFIWYKFANDYLEKTKDRKNDAQKLLEYILWHSLVLLHPFMPFITEVIYQDNYSKGKKDMLIASSWPG